MIKSLLRPLPPATRAGTVWVFLVTILAASVALTSAACGSDISPTPPPTQIRPDLPTVTKEALLASPTLRATPIPITVGRPATEPTNTPRPSGPPTPSPNPIPSPSELVAADMPMVPAWFLDPPDHAHSIAAEAVAVAWLHDRDLAAVLLGFPWTMDGTDQMEADVLVALAYTAVDAPELARSTAGLPWMQDGITPYESMAAGAVRDMAGGATPAATELETLPWFRDGVTREETWAIRVIRDAAALNGDNALLLVRTPWIADGLSDAEAHNIQDLSKIPAWWDGEWTAAVVRFHWFSDGLTELDLGKLNNIGFKSGYTTEVAKKITTFPWVRDGISDLEDEGLNSIRKIASVEPLPASAMVNAPWLGDGIDYQEQQGLHYLSVLKAQDRELGAILLSEPWIMDGLTYHEQMALEKLSYVNSRERELSRQLAALLRDGVNRRNQSIWESLGRLAVSHRPKLRELADANWIKDGISPEDAAFLVTVNAVHKASPDLLSDIVETRYTESATVSTPLSGEVRLWVISNAPVVQPRKVLDTMADGVQAVERLTMTPLRTNDVILLAIRQEPGVAYDIPWAGAYTNGHIIVPTSGNYPLSSRTIYHEIGHYYFGFFPVWLMEGGANFVASYVQDRNGVRSLADRVQTAGRSVESSCRTDGIHNLQQLEARQGFYFDDNVLSCNYVFGEFFLINLYQAVGESTVARALRDLNLLIRGEGRGIPLSEKDIYLAFLDNTAPTDQESLRQIFRQYYGAALIDADTNVADDHGDTVATATGIASSVTVHGHLEHPFDADYFRLAVQAGQTYTVRFKHGARNDYYLKIIPPGQETWGYLDSQRGGASGVRADWTPAVAGGHYLVVQSATGAPGPYTLHVAPAVVGADAQGDTVASSQPIDFAVPVTAHLDNPSDLDYFRFRATRGNWYEISVETQDFDYSRVRLRDANDDPVHENFAEFRSGRKGASLEWEPTETGYYYAVVGSPRGSTGEYTLTVTEFVPERDDHGNSASDATGLVLGRPVAGALDYGFDQDFFSFDAQGGRSYQIRIEFLTLPAQSIAVIGPDGKTVVTTIELETWLTPGASVVWEAPQSGEHYLAIHGPDGHTGTYTINLSGG